MYKIRATVVDMNGTCHYHKVGDYVEVARARAPNCT